MKKLFVLAAIITGTLFATKSDAQVYVGARFGPVGIRIAAPVYHRPYYRGPVYGGAYVAPAPVYAAPAPVYAPAPAPVYADPAYGPAPVDYSEFPGYAYYNYPVWNGHFRDRIYYEHYRPTFFREHPYYRSFYHGRR